MHVSLGQLTCGDYVAPSGNDTAESVIMDDGIKFKTSDPIRSYNTCDRDPAMCLPRIKGFP